MPRLEKKCCARKSFARFSQSFYIVQNETYAQPPLTLSASSFVCMCARLCVCVGFIVGFSLRVFFPMREFFFCICKIVDSCSVFNSSFAANEMLCDCVWKNIRHIHIHIKTVRSVLWCCAVYTTAMRCVSAFLLFHLSHHQQTKEKRNRNFALHIHMRSIRMRTHIFTRTIQHVHAASKATRKKHPKHKQTNKQAFRRKSIDRIKTAVQEDDPRLWACVCWLLVRFIIYVLCASISTSFICDVNILMMKTLIHWLCCDQATQPRFIIWIRSSKIYLHREYLRGFVRYLIDSLSRSLSLACSEYLSLSRLPILWITIT